MFIRVLSFNYKGGEARWHDLFHITNFEILNNVTSDIDFLSFLLTF